MIKVTNVDNMRRSDLDTVTKKVASKELMYRAGKGIYDSVLWHGKTLIVCGTGNNAGDGYVVASLMHDNGYEVELLLLEEKFSDDGKYYFDRCVSQNVPWSVYNSQSIDGYDMILDCIFGTGFKGGVTGRTREVVEKINASGAFIVSCDINSGLNGDSGMAELCVKSDLTISIGTLKSGHFLNMAKDNIKSLINIDIGIDLIDEPFYLLEKKDAGCFLGKRYNFSNKGTYGYITLLGGSLEYSGAIKLANLAGSAMRSGAGVVKLAVPKSLADSVAPYLLESTLYPLGDGEGVLKFCENEIQGALKGVKAVGIGMGLGQLGDNEKILEYILKNYELPVVIDADGLNSLARMDISLVKESRCQVIVTPHPKELERLLGVTVGEILENPIKAAQEYAKKSSAVVLLKGPTTVITDGKKVILTNTGCAGMATAGSGDVLSGIITALCASHADALTATAVGAYINGLAGEMAQRKYGEISMVASDTAKCVGQVIKSIELSSANI